MWTTKETENITRACIVRSLSSTRQLQPKCETRANVGRAASTKKAALASRIHIGTGWFSVGEFTHFVLVTKGLDAAECRALDAKTRDWGLLVANSDTSCTSIPPLCDASKFR
jgi:hypothetical protein